MSRSCSVHIEGEGETRKGQCFYVGVDTPFCFEITADYVGEIIDPFGGFNKPPRPLKDTDLPFNVFAVHVQHGKIFLAIEERPPDDAQRNVWIDNFGGVNKTTADGNDAYVPDYWATSFEAVFYDADHPIAYTVITGDDGRNILVFSEEIIGLFVVEYKINVGHKIIKADFTPSPTGLEYAVDFQGEERQMNSNQIGEGCLIIGHQDAEHDSKMLFVGKDNVCWSLDPDTLEINRLSFSNPTYMVDPTTAYNYASQGAYLLESHNAENTHFIQNASVKITEAVSYSYKRVCFMQNIGDGKAMCFREWEDDTKTHEKGLDTDVYWTYYEPCHDSGWAGYGEVGNVVDAKPNCRPICRVDSFMSCEAWVIYPLRPALVDPLTLKGNISYDASLTGMAETGRRYDGTTGSPVNPKPHKTQARISWKHFYERHLIGLDGKLYCFRLYEETEKIKAHDFPTKYSWGYVHPICDIKDTDDFCCWGDFVVVVDGKNKLKMYPQMISELPPLNI